MKVRIKSVYEKEAWYADSINMEFDVANIQGAYYGVPIPFVYYKLFLPFLLILKTDCEVIADEEG